MFKKILALVVLASVSTVAFGQGAVNFVTQNLGVDALVYQADGTKAAGSTFLAQLYAAPTATAAETALLAVGDPVNFRSGTTYSGYVQVSGTVATTSKPINTTVMVFSGAPAGGPATVQLRAWDSAYATYEAALTAGAQHGFSPLLSLAVTGDPVGGLGTPTLPVDLIGLKGFTMTGGAIIPEPSSIALMLLGGAALLIRRRK